MINGFKLLGGEFINNLFGAKHIYRLHSGAEVELRSLQCQRPGFLTPGAVFMEFLHTPCDHVGFTWV